MKRSLDAATVVLTLLAFPAHAADAAKAEKKRARIDALAGDTLEKLFGKHDKARVPYDKAHGYAVFDNTKVSRGITGGGGGGVAGASAAAVFRSGMAVYQLTDAGLMLQADVSGTKYWKSKKLNRPPSKNP